MTLIFAEPNPICAYLRYLRENDYQTICDTNRLKNDQSDPEDRTSHKNHKTMKNPIASRQSIEFEIN